jgi:hypothetical protein
MPVADLIAVASRALSDRMDLSHGLARAAGALAPALAAMLAERNGFYAFGPALHVLSTAELVAWNAPTLWKDAYAGFPDPGLCFAEELFGNQFTIRDDRVQLFQVETGTLEPFADTLDGWADRILEDSAFETGWPTAEEWKERHGPMPVGTRMHPATPFVAGGAYEIDNLRPVASVELMRFWGDFARQIRDLPDGAKIELVVGKKP